MARTGEGVTFEVGVVVEVEIEFHMKRPVCDFKKKEMGYRYIEKLVREFQEDDKYRLEHYNDLNYACLSLFNRIVDGLRKGNLGGVSFVDIVLET